MKVRTGHKERTARDKHKERRNRTREEKKKKERDKVAEQTRNVGTRDNRLTGKGKMKKEIKNVKKKHK
jgi:hypothetical protein